jgi:hypothetical protein
MDLETFQHLTRAEVAEEVRRADSTVCAFAANGTRRWFLLEHPNAPASDYIEVSVRRQVELYRLLFDHGLDTLLIPVFEPVMHKRGEEYRQRSIPKILSALATHPTFTSFYQDYQVRVLFYGDYRQIFPGTECADIPAQFEQITAKTQMHRHYRIFFGVSARHAIETAMGLSIQAYLKHGRVPDREALIEMYYGELISPVSLFITSGKFNAFGMPLLATEDTSLYFTVAPSPFLTEQQLRAILYDHLYQRRLSAKSSYSDLTSDEFDRMRTFYYTYRETTQGIGVVQNGTWYPLFPNVTSQ